MDEFTIPTDPPAIVRPHVSNEERIGQLVREAQEHDNAIKFGIARCGEDMVYRGNALNKAMQLAGKGKLKEVLEKHWKGRISTRTAYRYMKMATADAVATMVAQFESHTHKQLDDKPDGEDSEDDETPPLTVQQRKVLYSLIETVKPGLAKKLRAGSKKFTDAELWKEVPPSCGKCQRFGPPPGKPCETCAKMRSDAKTSLFDSEQEPADEDDPASGPKPPPDPYAKAKKLATEFSTLMTKLAADNKPLYDALVACKLMDHTKDTPSFCAVVGTKKIIEMVEAGETLAATVTAYKIMSGGFIPPMYEKRGRS